MTARIRTTTEDLWIINEVEYGVSSTSSEGVVLVEIKGAHRARTFHHEELLGLLRSGDADLKRDYFAVEEAKCRLHSPVEFLRDLEREMLLLVLWRLAYLQTFVAAKAEKRVRRTAKAVTAILPELERQVDQQESARQGLAASASPAPRAGRKTYKRRRPSASTLLTWVRRWEDAGEDPRGLIPRSYRSGNYQGRFPAKVEALISEGLDAYASIQRPTIRSTASKIVQRVRHLNRERRADGLKRLRVPSKRTIARRIAGLDAYGTYAKRYGPAAANRKFAAYEHGIKAGFPMERVEIDEWKVDLLTLLDTAGLRESLSPEAQEELRTTRLWLYLGICCATRCVVGMHLCDQPNAKDAIRLVSLMTRNKTDLALAAGCESPWHHGGGIGLVSTDQGSAFVDERFQTVLADLRVLTGQPPAELPRLRGRVERIFRTFGTQIMPLLAGRTFSNPIERGDYPSEALAVHTRESLMRVLTVHVVDIYHNTPHRGLDGETPADCWDRLSAKMGTLPCPSAIQRTAVFGWETERKLTGGGVTAYGIRYACNYLRERHKRVGDETIRIRTNPEDLGFVMVWNGAAWVQARALQSCFNGVSLGQWRQASRELRLRHAERAELQERVVERALKKVEDINADQIAKFNVTIPFLTEADLAREERQLHLGLTIRPEDQPSLISRDPQIPWAPRSHRRRRLPICFRTLLRATCRTPTPVTRNQTRTGAWRTTHERGRDHPDNRRAEKRLYYRQDVHTQLRSEFDRLLSGRREEVRQGITREGRGIALLGPSGSGKTTAIEYLLTRHPDLVLPAPNQERADIISFRVPSPATLKDVGMTALDALGYPLSRDRPTGIIWALVREFLQKRQTLFLHIDEAQDLNTSNSEQVRQNVINTLKSLMQQKDWPVSIILSGMPEVRKMLNFDTQLARRFYPIQLRPLSFVGDEPMLRDMLRAYLAKANLRPSTDIVTEDFLLRLLHGGVYEFGLVIELIIAGIEEALIDASEAVEAGHFALAFRRRTGCHDGMNPFITQDYRDTDPRKLFPDLGD